MTGLQPRCRRREAILLSLRLPLPLPPPPLCSPSLPFCCFHRDAVVCCPVRLDDSAIREAERQAKAAAAEAMAKRERERKDRERQRQAALAAKAASDAERRDAEEAARKAAKEAAKKAALEEAHREAERGRRGGPRPVAAVGAVRAAPRAPGPPPPPTGPSDPHVPGPQHLAETSDLPNPIKIVVAGDEDEEVWGRAEEGGVRVEMRKGCCAGGAEERDTESAGLGDAEREVGGGRGIPGPPCAEWVGRGRERGTGRVS